MSSKARKAGRVKAVRMKFGPVHSRTDSNLSSKAQPNPTGSDEERPMETVTDGNESNEAETTEIELSPDAGSQHDEHEDSQPHQLQQSLNDKPVVGWYAVLILCLTEIFGAIFFLRVGFIVGIAGISETIFMIFLASFISLLTILSMTIICQTGTIRAGGVYFMISRNLGDVVGGGLSILYCLARIATIGFYLVGLAETITYGVVSITDSPKIDVRIWSITILIIITLLMIYIERKAQNKVKLLIYILICLLIVMALGIFLIFIGSFYKTGGWNNDNLKANTKSNYTNDYKFGSLFLIFFPVYSSLTIGADISGDLENSSKSIPKGTLISVAISVPVYILMVVCVGAVVTRDELVQNDLILADIAVSPGIVFMALIIALLSSAIAAFMTAPNIQSAMAKEGINGCCLFCDDYKMKYGLVFGVSLYVCIIEKRNDIAPWVTQIFLLTNLMINIACCACYKHEKIVNSDNKYIKPWICIMTGVIASIATITMMLWIDYISCFIVIGIMFAMFFIYYMSCRSNLLADN